MAVDNIFFFFIRPNKTHITRRGFNPKNCYFLVLMTGEIYHHKTFAFKLVSFKSPSVVILPATLLWYMSGYTPNFLPNHLTIKHHTFFRLPSFFHQVFSVTGK